VACRRRRPKRELVRFVARDGRLVQDPDAVLPGRGAYCCPEPACWERALTRRAFPRALRRPVAAEAETVDFTADAD